MSPTGKASPVGEISLVSFLTKIVCVYMRGKLALLGEISLLIRRDLA